MTPDSAYGPRLVEQNCLVGGVATPRDSDRGNSQRCLAVAVCHTSLSRRRYIALKIRALPFSVRAIPKNFRAAEGRFDRNGFLLRLA